MDYVLNYDQIVREFCINREKQEMMCSGKCYFFDELAKTSDAGSSEGISSSTTKIQEIYLFAATLNLNFVEFESSENNPIINYFENHYNFRFLESVFHPPLYI